MGRKKGIFGLLGVLVVGGILLIAELTSPRGMTLTELGGSVSLSKIGEQLITTEIATAEAADDAHALEADDAPALDSDPALRGLSRDEKRLLGENDDDASQEQADSSEKAREIASLKARIKALEARTMAPAESENDAELADLRKLRTSLESQQEALIQEVLSLKRQLRERDEKPVEIPGEDGDDVETLRSQLGAWKERATKDRANLKVLADHILKLREEIKGLRTEVAAKSDALNERGAQLAKLEGVNAEAEKLGDTNRTINAQLEGLRTQRDNLANQLQDAQQKNVALEDAVSGLRAKVQEVEGDRTKLSGSCEQTKTELTARDEELEDTKRQLSKTIEDMRSCSSSLDEKTKSGEKLPQLEQQLTAAAQSVSAKDAEIASLKRQLEDKEQIASSIPGLKRDLLAAKNQLLMKEKELRLLGKAGSPEHSSPELLAEKDRILEQSGRIAGEESIRGKKAIASDVMVVEVTGNRVALRSGPSPDDSEIMPVGKGTRLTVEERIGDWYRVVAPNSTRAFIRSDMVRIISGGEQTAAAQPPVVKPSAPRVPSKRPLKVAPTDSDMEPFGDVNAGADRAGGDRAGGDRVDRAVQSMKSDLSSQQGKQAPAPPALVE